MSGGNAITSRDQDRLGRGPFADHIAARLRAEAADEGLVVALLGPWGTGKTSVLNMVVEQLRADPARVVRTFNPWMFSGREQLVARFFEQITAQLRVKFGKTALADQFASYGQAVQPLMFVPVAGVWIARAGGIVTAVGRVWGKRKRPDPVDQQQEAIKKALGQLPAPIFVVIDDIDRLTASEVRDMLGLVRLTAHFPKVIYVLAFDRAKVERALGEDDPDGGRSYLSKIVEIPYDLPATPGHALQKMILEGIEEAISGMQLGPFDRSRWPAVFHGVLVPLLGTPREVGRYLAALPAMLAAIGDEVSLVDVLALETLRMRLPDVFAQLGPMSQALSDVGMLTSARPGWEAEVVSFTASAGADREVVADLCRLLFPATERYLGNSNKYWASEWLSRWRKERRVASPEVLGVYLSKQLPPGALPAAAVDAAVRVMEDGPALQAIVGGLSAVDLDDLLARLSAYEDDIPPAAARSAIGVLLGVYPRLRTWSLGFLDMGPEIAVDRLALRLLRRVEDLDERIRIVEALCAEVPGFTGRMRLLRNAGRRPNPDFERLAPADVLEQLYQRLCAEIRHASADQIVAERDPLDLLSRALEEDPSDRDGVDELLRDLRAAEAVLFSARASLRSHPHESGLAMEEEPILRWELLGIVVGDDRAIEDLVDRVAAGAVGSAGDAAAIVELSRRYLSGWRPSLGPLVSRQPVVRQALNSPGTIFSPSVIGSQWPTLLLRAVTTYEIDKAWAGQADVSGRPFHDRLAAALTRTGLAGHVAALASARGLPAGIGAWQPDEDAVQLADAAVQRLTIGSADQPSAVLRYAVFLPSRGGPMKLIADIAVSPSEETDAQWGRLQLQEVRDAIATGLQSVAGTVADEIVRSVYSGELAPRASVEMYLWSAQGQSTGRDATLASLIDIGMLGAPTKPGQQPLQAQYAVAGDTITSDVLACRNLAVHALVRMALDLGYLDAPASLATLASP